jgi:hypothetical protein
MKNFKTLIILIKMWLPANGYLTTKKFLHWLANIPEIVNLIESLLNLLQGSFGIVAIKCAIIFIDRKRGQESREIIQVCQTSFSKKDQNFWETIFVCENTLVEIIFKFRSRKVYYWLNNFRCESV